MDEIESCLSWCDSGVHWWGRWARNPVRILEHHLKIMQVNVAINGEHIYVQDILESSVFCYCLELWFLTIKQTPGQDWSSKTGTSERQKFTGYEGKLIFHYRLFQTFMSMHQPSSTKRKHTTVGIRWWSPTQLLIHRSTACVWQSGRDAHFSVVYGRMCLPFLY